MPTIGWAGKGFLLLGEAREKLFPGPLLPLWMESEDITNAGFTETQNC